MTIERLKTALPRILRYGIRRIFKVGLPPGIYTITPRLELIEERLARLELLLYQHCQPGDMDHRDSPGERQAEATDGL